MPRFKVLKTDKYLQIIIVSIILFVVSAAFAASHKMVGLERQIFDFIYEWNIDMLPVFWATTQLGSVWAAISGLAIFWYFKKRQLAIKLLIGGGFTYALTQIAKVLIDRDRPIHLIPGLVERETLVSGNGFPSGHTAFITVFCVIIQPYLPKQYRWLAWLAVVAVATSRIYLGVHAPLDIVGGFAIGLAVGYSIRFLQPKLNSKK